MCKVNSHALLLTMLTVASSTAANAASRQERFKEFLAVIEDDGNGRADEKEIGAFLLANKAALIENLNKTLGELGLQAVETDPGEDSSDDWFPSDFALRLEEIASSALGSADGNGLDQEDDPTSTYGIEASELDAFLGYKFPPPFQLKMADLFPDSVKKGKKDEGKPEENFLVAAKRYLSIRQSALDSKEIAKPASLSVARLGSNDDRREAGQDKTTVDIDGAVIITPCGDGSDLPIDAACFHWRNGDQIGLAIRPFIAVDVDVDTKREANEDQITHRLGLDIDTANDIDAFVTGHNFDFSIDFTTDRDYDKEIYGGTFQWSPNIPRLFIGEKVPLDEAENALFNWRPYLLAEYGEVSDAAGNTALDEDNDFLNASLRATFEFGYTEYFKLVPEFTLTQELMNDKDLHGLYGVSARFLPTGKDDFSLQFSYTRGEKRPTFTDVDSVDFGLGLKF